MSKRKQVGVSLIEVMIALVVLSVGLLGLAVLQFKALQGTHAAYQATLASLIATDAEERLWLARAEGVVSDEAVQDDWRTNWTNVLPGVETSSSIAEDAGTFTISVIWSESRFGGDATERFEYEVTLP
ncbi:MAG: type pilus assembly protein PilV [Rhodocyclaceae bacterium]|nr:type pilus assembly protein PilV [Rhodocyclaceae bacterium]